MNCKKILETIDALNEKYISVWEDVCNLESPTADKAGVDAVSDYFIKMADERNWEIEVLKLEQAGNAVCITMNPHADAAPVVFSGHIDTVHPVGLFGAPAVRFDETYVYGPGVTDCKGGVVASFLALDALDTCGFTERPVRLILQSDEETGSKNSGKRTVAFMCEKSAGAVAFLNTEGTEGLTAALVRKGILRYRFRIHGKASHSSRCYEGANAIAEAAHKILKLEMMKDKAGLTCNCGVIEGGTVANTVAAECSFLADIRFFTREEEAYVRQLVQKLAAEGAIPGCSCELEEVSYRPSMPLVERNRALLTRMNEIYAECGLPQLAERVCFGGSDAAYITAAGIPCVDSIGVDGKGIHSIREYARIASLAEAAKRLAVVAACI